MPRRSGRGLNPTLTILAILLLTAGGCTEQRSESDEPSGEEVRDVSRFLPGQGPGAPSWQPAMPADASPSENVSPTTLGLPPHESPAIRGTIRVAENATPPPGGVLFIIARPAGSRGGPPAAAKRIDGARFPLAYSLSKQDAMIAGRELSPFESVPDVLLLTRTVVPVCVSWTNMSRTPLVSPGTRLVESL